MLKLPETAELHRLANSDSEAWELWQWQDCVRDAASAAVQRMPRLAYMKLISGSATGPNFEVIREGGERANQVDISWSWFGKRGDQG